jgi:hypothetical protein
VTTRADKRYPFRINSGLFREMLNGSAAPTSIDSPLSVDEHSEDFEIMLLILNGRGDEVMDRAKTWEYSAKLYGLVDKYRIEGHRYWFSQICRSQAAKASWEAIFLACKQSPVDTTIIGPAIAEGFATRLFSEVCDPSYFTNLHAEHGAYSSFKNPNSYPDGRGKHKHWVLDAGNISILLGRCLGHTGLLAYTLTFSGLASCPVDKYPDWNSLSQRFIRNVLAIEAQTRSL